ncbi:MAG: TolB family protein, partial [Vicinamibacteria bacterium]
MVNPKTLICCLSLAAVSVAQEAKDDKPTGLTLLPERTIAFDTTEGTYMNLDVSPDGATIVFDLLGDLYTIPAGGGEATRLTSGTAYDIQPVFSPDGKEIAFVSDQSGSYNIWVVSPDGSSLEQVTKETDEPVVAPEWSPDDDYLVARRGGKLWLYHRRGGDGMAISSSE